MLQDSQLVRNGALVWSKSSALARVVFRDPGYETAQFLADLVAGCHQDRRVTRPARPYLGRDRVTSDRADGVDDFLDGNASSEKSVTTSAFFSATSLGFLHVGAGRGVVISGSDIGMLSLKGWTYGKLERTSPLQNCSARKRWRVARLE
jgi:hypothetical protein